MDPGRVLCYGIVMAPKKRIFLEKEDWKCFSVHDRELCISLHLFVICHNSDCSETCLITFSETYLYWDYFHCKFDISLIYYNKVYLISM